MPIPIPPHLLLSIPRVGASAYYGGSTLLATVLAHNLYKSTPEWVRNDESWKALGGIQNDDDNNDVGFVDEMASLTAVISKLEGLVIDGYEKLGSQRRMGRRRHIVNSVSKCNLKEVLVVLVRVQLVKIVAGKKHIPIIIIQPRRLTKARII